MEFHKILRKLRDEKKLTLNELALKLNLTIPTLSNYENNRRMPNIETLKLLADFFGVSIEYLTTGKEKQYLKLPQLVSYSNKPSLSLPQTQDMKDLIKETIKEVNNEHISLRQRLEDLIVATGEDLEVSEADKQTILALVEAQMRIVKKS